MLFLLAGVLVVLGTAFGAVHGVQTPSRKTYAVALARGEATEPSGWGLAGEAVSFALSDGAASTGWVLDGQQPDGPGVVILHGFSDSRFGSLGWAARVAAHASVVVVFDQRAHGDAEGKAFRAGAIEAADVLAVLDQAEAVKDPPAGWVLFGLSAGGGMALRTAGAYPEETRLRGVIAEGIYRYSEVPLRNVLAYRKYPTWPTVALASAWASVRGQGRRTFDRAAWAGRVKVPVLMLHGQADPICPHADAEQVAALAEAAGVDVTFVSVPGGGHLDLHQIDADIYKQALTDFFEKLKPGEPHPHQDEELQHVGE